MLKTGVCWSIVFVHAFKRIVAIPTDMLPVAHDPEPISAEDDIYYDSDHSSDADKSKT